MSPAMLKSLPKSAAGALAMASVATTARPFADATAEPRDNRRSRESLTGRESADETRGPAASVPSESLPATLVATLSGARDWPGSNMSECPWLRIVI